MDRSDSSTHRLLTGLSSIFILIFPIFLNYQYYYQYPIFRSFYTTVCLVKRGMERVCNELCGMRTNDREVLHVAVSSVPVSCEEEDDNQRTTIRGRRVTRLPTAVSRYKRIERMLIRMMRASEIVIAPVQIS